MAGFRDEGAARNMTTLNLLTREGVVTVTFDTDLDPQRYEELHDVVQVAGETKASLCEELVSLSKKWGSKMETDGC